MPLTYAALASPKSDEHPERDSNPTTACQSYKKRSREESRTVKCPMQPEYAVWKREHPQAAYYKKVEHDEISHSHRLPSLERVWDHFPGRSYASIYSPALFSAISFLIFSTNSAPAMSSV